MTDLPALPIVLATRNRKKGRELFELLAPPWEHHPRLARLAVRTLDDRPDVPDVVEDGDTFAANARKKATEVAQAVGLWALADDSGLCVDALGGAPGIYSARYAGEPGDDERNNDKLLAALADTPDELRGAAFHCALAVSDPDGRVVLEAEGTCRGRIVRDRRGPGGFGYDPLFLIPEYGRTFGELGSIVKQQLSHRARALGRLRPGLERLIASGAMG